MHSREFYISQEFTKMKKTFQTFHIISRMNPETPVKLVFESGTISTDKQNPPEPIAMENRANTIKKKGKLLS